MVNQSLRSNFICVFGGRVLSLEYHLHSKSTRREEAAAATVQAIRMATNGNQLTIQFMGHRATGRNIKSSYSPSLPLSPFISINDSH